MKATITNVEINLPIEQLRALVKLAGRVSPNDQFKRGITKEECDAISVFWQDMTNAMRTIEESNAALKELESL